MNVGSVVDKFFSDCLTETGRILDDNYEFVVFNSFCFGGLVKGNPFVRVTITEIEPRKNKMRVFLEEKEIRQALSEFIARMNLPDVTGVNISTESGELTAELLFGDVQSTDDSVEEEQPKKSRGGRPVGSKNKPKETSNVGVPPSNGSDRASEGGGERSGASSSEDDDDDLFTKPKGRPTENPSEGSSGESSKDADGGSEENGPGDPEETETPVSAKKKPSSIFDDED